MSLKGKRALVTGSTSGIGRGIAHALASKGCSVVLTGVTRGVESGELVQEFKNSYSGDFDFVPGDFADPFKTQQFSEDILALYPQGVDILVNSAGIPGRDTLEDLSLQSWLDTLSVNLTAPFVLTKAFFPLMKERRWGRIVHIGSVNSLISDPGKAAYSSSKSGLNGLTRVTALEGAEYGVTCNTVCPGFTDAPMGKSIVAAIAKDQGVSFDVAVADFLQNVNPPTKRIIQVSEVAELVAYLCSEHACSITGTSIPIDGGHICK